MGIATIAFLLSFSLDVFGGDSPVFQQLLGFLIHSLPALVLVLALVLAWHFERLGGAIFLVLSMLPFVFLSNVVWVNAMLAAPLVVTGTLFLTAGILHQNSRTHATDN